MATIGNLVVELRATADKFNAGLRDAQKEVKAFERAWAPTLDLVETGAKIIGAGALAIAGAIAAATKIAADYGDQMRDAAIKTGLTTETMAGLKLMAEQSGTSLNAVTAALTRLAVSSNAATEGSKAQQEAFAAIGITSKELAATNGDLDKTMRLVMDHLSVMPESTQKTAAMVTLLGKSSAELKEFLAGGTDALDLFTRKTELFGTDIGREAADTADGFNDSLNNMKQALLGATLMAGNEFLPVLTQVVTVMTAGIIAARQFAESLIAMGKAALGVTSAFSGVSESGLMKLLAGFVSAVPGAQTATLSLASAYAELQQIQAETAKQTKIVSESFGDAADAAEKAAKAAKAWAKSMQDASDDILQIYDGLEGERSKFAAIAIDRIKEEAAAAKEFANRQAEDIIAEEKRAAEETQRIWENALGNVTANFAQAFTDVIFESRNFGDALIGIAKETASGMLEAFLVGLMSPLNKALGDLGRSLSGVGGGAGAAGGIGGLGGLLGGLGPLGAFTGAYALTSWLLNRGRPDVEYGSYDPGMGGTATWVRHNYASGTDYVPQTGPYGLHRGEAVLTSEDNASIKALLTDIRNLMAAGGHVYLDGKKVGRTLAPHMYSLTRDDAYHIVGGR